MEISRIFIGRALPVARIRRRQPNVSLREFKLDEAHTEGVLTVIRRVFDTGIETPPSNAAGSCPTVVALHERAS
jgi:hypothetical protein